MYLHPKINRKIESLDKQSQYLDHPNLYYYFHRISEYLRGII